MSNALQPCPSCRRHVRGRESECPFCGLLLDGSFAAAVVAPAVGQHLSRAALLALGASFAASGAACAGEVDPDDDGTGGTSTSSGGMPSVGGSGVSTGGEPLIAPAYGIPPMGGFGPETGGTGGGSERCFDDSDCAAGVFCCSCTAYLVSVGLEPDPCDCAAPIEDCTLYEAVCDQATGACTLQ